MLSLCDNNGGSISCPLNRVNCASDVFEDSAARTPYYNVDPGGRLDGCLVIKLGIDRGGGSTKFGGINCSRNEDANSCKQYDPLGTFWDAPDNYANVYDVFLKHFEKPLVDLDKSRMLILGKVFDEGERVAKVVPRDCIINDLSNLVTIDESMEETPAPPQAPANSEWAICVNASGEACGVGLVDAATKDVIGLYKLRCPFDLESDAKVITVKIEIFFVFDIAEICNVLGHQGCASTYPCPLCLLHKDYFGLNFDDLTEEPTRRTLADMHECKRLYDLEGAYRKRASEFMNVVKKPMLSIHWDMKTKVVVPQVHAVTLGFGNACSNTLLWNIREFELYQFIDQWGTIGMLNEEAFESIHAHMNTLRRRYVCVRNAVDRERLIKKCFDTMQATMASTQKLTDGRKRIYKSKVVPRVDASDIPEAS